MIVALFAATVFLAEGTTAAPANPPAPAAAADAKKKAEADPNKLVCHSEPVLGSRMPVKRCTTAAQAAEDKRAAREELEKVQDQQRR